MEAWQQVRRNGGSAGVDGETFKNVESYGVDRWLGDWRGSEGDYKESLPILPRRVHPRCKVGKDGQCDQRFANICEFCRGSGGNSSLGLASAPSVR